MLLLLIDTSGPDAGVALVRDGGTVYTASKRHKNTHSESILPMTQKALHSVGLSVSDVDLFAAVVGPGSFTGVRIGVSTVRGFAHVTGKPCVGVNALEAIASRFPYERYVCPMLDARRSQVYTAAFENGRRLIDDCAISVDEFTQTIPTDIPALFVGDGAIINAELIKARLPLARFAPAHLNRLCPEAAAHLAYRDANKAHSFADLNPVYLRAPQAERNLKSEN